MIATGAKSAVIFPTNEKSRRVKKGDTVRVDVGCEYKGYCSDVSRTIAVGSVSADRKRILKATTRGYTETIKSLRPGLVISNIFHQAVSTVRAAGIPDYQRTDVGHGIGLEVHELPSLSPDQNGVLQKDMVLNIETPYYCFGVGGFACEDTVRITSDGHELLTHLEREIKI
jgi:Xaa-Pro aminopeptidase